MKGLSIVVMKRLMTRLRPGATGMTNRFSVEKPPCSASRTQEEKRDRAMPSDVSECLRAAQQTPAAYHSASMGRAHDK